MSVVELRPLSLGELLDRAFLLYRRNFRLFAGIVAIPSCLVIPARFLFLRSQGLPFPWNRPSPESHHTAYFFLLLFISWVIYTVAQAATTYAVSDAYLGRPITVREAYEKMFGHFWQVVEVTFGVAIGVCVITFLMIIPVLIVGIILIGEMSKGLPTESTPVVGLTAMGTVLAGVGILVWASVRYSISLPTALLEDVRGSAAIRRSVQLTRGRRGELFVAFLLGVVVSYTAAIILQGPFYVLIAVTGMNAQLPTWLILAMSASSSIGGAIASPLLMIILVLFYYDLRIRKEGFDLQHMMTSLPEPNPAGSTTPA